MGNVSFANWHFLTGVNKLKWLYTGKVVAHVGDPPRWWPFVRLRTREIHTQVEVASRWQVCRRFVRRTSATREKVQLLPAFDGRSLWNATGSLFRIEGNNPLVIVAEGPKLSQEIIEALCSLEGPLCFLGRKSSAQISAPPARRFRLCPFGESTVAFFFCRHLHQR